VDYLSQFVALQSSMRELTETAQLTSRLEVRGRTSAEVMLLIRTELVVIGSREENYELCCLLCGDTNLEFE